MQKKEAVTDTTIEKNTSELVSGIRNKRPVVLSITNMVTVNDCANILLAIGASPIMAHAKEEVAEIVQKVDALVLNLGATEYAEAMLIAGETARKYNKPIVFDPVGVAASTYRRGLAYEIINRAKPDCIRGNYSEINALYHNHNTASGVDECMESDKESTDIKDVVLAVAKNFSCIVIASGEVDVISDGNVVYQITGGSKMMRQITGAGCMSSVLLGAFLAVDSCLASAYACLNVVNECAEAGEKKQKALNGGSMTFHDAFIDAVSLYKVKKSDK